MTSTCSWWFCNLAICRYIHNKIKNINIHGQVHGSKEFSPNHGSKKSPASLKRTVTQTSEFVSTVHLTSTNFGVQKTINYDDEYTANDIGDLPSAV